MALATREQGLVVHYLFKIKNKKANKYLKEPRLTRLPDRELFYCIHSSQYIYTNAKTLSQLIMLRIILQNVQQGEI